MDTTTKTAIDAAKTASKRVAQKTAEDRGDLIGNKIAAKIAEAGKTKSVGKEDETIKDKKFTYHQKKTQQIIYDLRFKVLNTV